MTALETELRAELERMSEAGTLKRIPVLRSPQGAVVELEGRGEVLCLCSNDYLGLANHPDVVRAGAEALARYGAGTASVRFICGNFAPQVELERDLAAFLRTGPRSRTSPAGTRTPPCSTRSATSAPRSSQTGSTTRRSSMACGSRGPRHKAVYEHADVDDLRRALSEAPAAKRRLIVTDGVFSMEGDLAPMPELAALAAEHEATLIVDDSHGLGVIGETGRGVLERFGLLGREDVILTGTLGKALGGAAGGFVAGSAALCAVLEQRSRPQLFSNGLPPAVAASARRALAELRDAPGAGRAAARRTPRRCARRSRRPASSRSTGESAIVPIIVGETSTAIRDQRAGCWSCGVYVTGFGYPVVPEGTARVRIQVSAALIAAQIETRPRHSPRCVGTRALATSASRRSRARRLKTSAHWSDLAGVDVLSGMWAAAKSPGPKTTASAPPKTTKLWASVQAGTPIALGRSPAGDLGSAASSAATSGESGGGLERLGHLDQLDATAVCSAASALERGQGRGRRPGPDDLRISSWKLQRSGTVLKSVPPLDRPDLRLRGAEQLVLMARRARARRGRRSARPRRRSRSRRAR